MSEAYIGEIRIFAGNFAPRGWQLCQGQILAISSNSALFSILGTTYGGNGQTTFGLPDLRGRFPTQQGQGPGLPVVTLGEVGGSPTTTLTAGQLPAHNHVTQPGAVTVSVAIPAASANADTASPAATKVLAHSVESTLGGTVEIYGNGPGDTTLTPFNATGTAASVQTSVAGGSQPVSIQNPYLGINYIICTEGIYPSRN